MSEEYADEGGTLTDPGGILSSGPRDDSNYFRVEHRAAVPCTCKPRRWALITVHQDGAECPRCQDAEEPQERRGGALLAELAGMLRDIPDTAGRVLGLVLILAALLGYLAATGRIPR